MALEEHQLNQLLNNPRESLSIELKNWIDPDSNEGKEKIVKAAIAMRNNNGGYLLIGFNNDDSSPNPGGAPQDVESSFHIDKIQGLITKYASEAFEVGVHYPDIKGTKYVVIEIPSGVKSPVATKSGIESNGRHYISAHKVFVRSLSSNNTPSTTESRWNDWPLIIEKCFENREADVGRFIRRHLASVANNQLSDAFLSIINKQEKSVSDKIVDFVNQSADRFRTIVDERNVSLPEHGSMEVGVIISGSLRKYTANRDFINLISSINPSLTGWPVWVDSRSFSDEEARPFVFNGAWEAFIASIDSDWADHLDYWRALPEGQFYLYRGLQDDIGGGDRAPKPGTVVDYGLVILRTTECIAVAIEFAKSMGAGEGAVLHFLFRWRGMQGRVISSWANPERMLYYTGAASQQDEVVAAIEIPIDTARNAISGYVHQVVSRLFEVFDGVVISEKVTDELVRKLLERRL